MGQDTKIEWTDHTLNFWWGCFKVSPGCANCYAETFSKRVGRNIWGPAKTTERWRTQGPWRDVLKWDRQAQAAGVRRRVFCQSMSDFFEDHPQLGPWRAEACVILESLKALEVQLLTKRPENVLEMVPASWREAWPAHIWIGTSVENQETANERIPHLLEIPARIRFLSCEPLLGPIDLSPYLTACEWCGGSLFGRHDCYSPTGIDWVIAGGESGPSARPMHPDWVRSLRDQCQAAGVAYFFKQWGEWGAWESGNYDHTLFLDRWMDHPEARGNSHIYHLTYEGRDSTLHKSLGGPWAMMLRVGKKAAGRLLDGVEWSEFPG